MPAIAPRPRHPHYERFLPTPILFNSIFNAVFSRLLLFGTFNPLNILFEEQLSSSHCSHRWKEVSKSE